MTGVYSKIMTKPYTIVEMGIHMICSQGDLWKELLKYCENYKLDHQSSTLNRNTVSFQIASVNGYRSNTVCEFWTKLI